MLSYAFSILKEYGYKNVEVEEFNNIAELFASILCKGVSNLSKKGLGRNYIPKEAMISSIKGKINVTESIKTMSILRNQLVCIYDDFSINNVNNKIIKSTLILLLKSDVSEKIKKDITNSLVYFTEVDEIDLSRVDWTMKFNRNNREYMMLISICKLVVKGLIQSRNEGSYKLMDFLDEQRMSRLYEKFILKYYQKHHPNISVSSPYINWQLDDEYDLMLPTMKTDVVLSHGDETLIIDAKYYSKSTQENFKKHSIHSSNLYQIFAYVKNQSLAEPNKKISGMLLYAKTDNSMLEASDYNMSGNKISVRELNLNQDFECIKNDLDELREALLPLN